MESNFQGLMYAPVRASLGEYVERHGITLAQGLDRAFTVFGAVQTLKLQGEIWYVLGAKLQRTLFSWGGAETYIAVPLDINMLVAGIQAEIVNIPTHTLAQQARITYRAFVEIGGGDEAAVTAMAVYLLLMMEAGDLAHLVNGKQATDLVFPNIKFKDV